MSDDIMGVPERVAGSSQVEPDGGSHERKFVPLPAGFSVNQGWVKIHRRITEWEWYNDLAVYRLFTHLLLTANHEEKHWQGQTIKAGQKITSLQHLAQETGLSLQSVRTALAKLKSTGELTYHTTNRFTHICIVKWVQYQVKSNTPLNTPLNNQSTTTKEVKKKRSKEVTSTEQSSENSKDVISLFKDLNPSYEILFKRKPQHDASRRLLEREGLERITRAVGFILSRKEDRFCPVVTTPIQLEEKWGQLEKYGASLKIKNEPKWKVWN